MELSTLTAISPLDGRYGDKTESLRAIFSEFGLIRHRLQVEIHWFKTLASLNQLPELPPLSKHAQQILESMLENFGLQEAQRVKNIERTTNHDVKAIEYFIKERISGVPELAQLSEFIHFACTSEDINNLAYGLMLRSARAQIILPALDDVIAALVQLAHRHAADAMLARTHGQAATPTTLGKEIANVVHRLRRQREQLAAVTLLGKMNGAVGNYNAHYAAYPYIKWDEVAKNFVESLGLDWNPYTTQIEPHDSIAEFCDVLARINTILIDFSRDVWGYVSIGYFKQRSVASEVGSSTMPHKINPIDFENAEGNLGLANALLNHFSAKLPVSRWQRDLSDSTVLRNLGPAIGYCLLSFQSLHKGLNKLECDKTRLAADLANNWDVLAEAIQTVMRRYGIPEPYEKMKALTRGKAIDQGQLADFIRSLALPEAAKDALLAMRPSDYVGTAVEQARKI